MHRKVAKGAGEHLKKRKGRKTEEQLKVYICRIIWSNRPSFAPNFLKLLPKFCIAFSSSCVGLKMTSKVLEKVYKMRKKSKNEEVCFAFLDREIEMMQDLKIHVQCLRSRGKSLHSLLNWLIFGKYYLHLSRIVNFFECNVIQKILDFYLKYIIFQKIFVGKTSKKYLSKVPRRKSRSKSREEYYLPLSVINNFVRAVEKSCILNPEGKKWETFLIFSDWNTHGKHV